MHNGFLTVNGEKMSKSLGNFITVHDLLGQDVDGDVIRLALLSTHYRKPLNWSEKYLFDAKTTMGRFKRFADYGSVEHPQEVADALNDDLNTPRAFAEMHGYLKRKQYGALAGALELMGF